MSLLAYQLLYHTLVTTPASKTSDLYFISVLPLSNMFAISIHS
jgi:hypothetical protein